MRRLDAPASEFLCTVNTQWDQYSVIGGRKPVHRGVGLRPPFRASTGSPNVGPFSAIITKSASPILAKQLHEYRVDGPELLPHGVAVVVGDGEMPDAIPLGRQLDR